MLDNFHFDYESLYSDLLDASRKAFIQLLNSHADEHFYLLGLFTDAENRNIGIVAYSEEKLAKTSRKMLDHDWTKQPELQLYSRLTLEDMMIYMRYEMGSDAYLCPYASLFSDINKSLNQRGQTLYEICCVADRLGESQVLQEEAAEHPKYIKVCCDVLRQLDLEHIFGEGEVRERIYLTFLNGDLDCSNNSCPDLNPKTVIERYLNEFEIEKDVNKIVNKNWERKRQYILTKKMNN